MTTLLLKININIKTKIRKYFVIKTIFYVN